MHARPFAASRLAAHALAAMIAMSFVPSHAQDFSKVTDPANPIVTLGAGPGGSFIGSAWVDSDGDGDLDLFVVRNGLFRNDGGGAFVHLPSAITSQGLATGTTWADVDNDGDLDCFVAGGAPSGSALYRNQGGNTFGKVTTGALGDTLTHFGWAAAFGDYDRDGWIDLVLAAPVGFNGVTGPNRLLHNDGTGGFTRIDSSTVATGLAFYTVPSWSDFDVDGDPDLFIGSGSGGGGLLVDRLYRNRFETQSGWLERYTTAPLGTDLHDGQLYNWVDYDNDGDLDVYLTNFGGNANDLYANVGGGVFVKRTAAEVGPIASDVSPSLASVWEDFDNDGDLDCYVTNAQTFAARFYRNDAGVFTALAINTLTGGGPHWGASAGDYDGDGRVDLYVNGNAATHGLYRNVTSNANHWLDVRLHGTASNRAGIGARVRVRSTIAGQPRWQMRETSSQNSFDGMNRLDTHFGLAEGTVVDSLVVEWPSGRTSVRTQVPADGLVEVTEPGDVTSVTASLVESSSQPGRVRIVWSLSSSAVQLVAVERSVAGGEWGTIGGARLEAGERVTLEDSAVAALTRYRYRLVVRDRDGEQRLGEVELLVPSAFALAVRPLGGPGPMRVELTLPAADAAQLELFDAAGRRVSRWSDASAQAGTRTIELADSGQLAPGLYLLRLRQSGASVSARVVRGH